MGAGAVDAVIRRLFSWPGVAGVAGLLALGLGVPWLMAGRAPQGFELPLAVAAVVLIVAPTWSMRRARSRSVAAATAELAHKRAMFRNELEQRLQVQGHLRESEARVRAIIDSAPIVLFATDRDGVITFSAGIGPDPLGKKPGEALGWSASDLFVEHQRVVDGIRAALSGSDGQVEQLGLLEQSVQESTDRLRHLLFELRPVALDEGGLPAALRESLEVMKREAAIDVELRTALERSPASETQVIAYRIAQEALGNVRKHARARRVECSVSAVDDGILTRIADDGLGFEDDRSRPTAGHLGLVSMRERAEMAGGWFRITSSRGNGCVVEYWIPDGKEGLSHAA